MKPPDFAYAAPDTLDEALELLADAGETAQVLAGGQSLLLDLRWRRRTPALVIDLNGIAELADITTENDAVRIGALVRHRELEATDAVPGPLGTLLAQAAPYIAHPPIRARGTVVGSLAWAHPASEWCALAAGLRATVTPASTAGVRRLPVSDFLLGEHRTAARPDELVTEISLPLLGDRARVGFVEARRTHASFAQLAVGVAVEHRAGTVAAAHIGVANGADRGLRAVAAERALIGTAGSAADLEHAADVAAETDAIPVARPQADVAYTRQLVRVLVRRALHSAVNTRIGAST